MFEIEMKFRVAGFESLSDALRKRHTTVDAPIVEADHYYNAPDRDFRRTDEALRLRRVGARNFATYKGPRLPGPTKTRKELEIPLRDGDEAAREFCMLLENLAYRPVAVVRKTRIIHHFQHEGFELSACLDDVENVGKYVELEIVAPEDKRQQAQDVIVGLAQEFGLDKPESRSYLALLVGNR